MIQKHWKKQREDSSRTFHAPYLPFATFLYSSDFSFAFILSSLLLSFSLAFLSFLSFRIFLPFSSFTPRPFRPSHFLLNVSSSFRFLLRLISRGIRSFQPCSDSLFFFRRSSSFFSFLAHHLISNTKPVSLPFSNSSSTKHCIDRHPKIIYPSLNLLHITHSFLHFSPSQLLDIYIHRFYFFFAPHPFHCSLQSILFYSLSLSHSPILSLILLFSFNPFYHFQK